MQPWVLNQTFRSPVVCSNTVQTVVHMCLTNTLQARLGLTEGIVPWNPPLAQRLSSEDPIGGTISWRKALFKAHIYRVKYTELWNIFPGRGTHIIKEVRRMTAVCFCFFEVMLAIKEKTAMADLHSVLILQEVHIFKFSTSHWKKNTLYWFWKGTAEWWRLSTF